MVITLIEYAIYLQAITAHNGDELDPLSGKLNTFPPLHNILVRLFFLKRLLANVDLIFVWASLNFVHLWFNFELSF